MSEYNGRADLIVGSVAHSGKAEFDRTQDGWAGWFEFGPDSAISVEEWRDLMLAESRDFSGSPAGIQIPGKTPRPATVERSEERIQLAGKGTPPWEDED
ncbi:MAG: hypothetical protein H0T78_06470 [Longispora sp.]|nr:hypothetical protein [Longispora sp. (in: high G+C Gram-positive bacteria)]